MKKFLLWIGALLAGEFLVMKRKDANFRNQIAKKEGREKVGYIFERLIQFNKELFYSAKEEVEKLDKDAIEEKVEHSKERIEGEYKKLKERFVSAEKEAETYSKEKISTLEEEFQFRLKQVEKIAKELGDDLDKQIGRKKKFAELKKLYENFEKKK